MEPLNATVEVRPDGCDIWVASQIQSLAQQTAAMVTGLPANKCLIHTQYLGGGFGRRGGADYVTEAVEIAKAMSPTPVKLTWTREDDLQHDTYRPASYVKFSGGLDAQGSPVSFSARVVCPPFGGNGTAVEGIQDMKYAIPNVAGGIHGSRYRDAGQLLAFGGLLAEHLLHGGVHRRDGRRGRSGSGRVPPQAAGGHSAPVERAESRGGKVRLGQAAAGRPLPRRRCRQQHRQLQRAGGRSFRSRKAR